MKTQNGLSRFHRLSGIVLAVFIALHLLNHLFALASPEQHIKVMEILRVVYRNVLIEVLLLAAVGWQVFSGTRLVFSKGLRNLPRFEKIQVYSGLYLAFFLVVHVGAVMSGRFLLKLDTNFYFAAAGLNLSVAPLFFIPYYALATVAVFSHIASVHYSKVLPNSTEKSASRQAYAMIALGFVISVLILYGFTEGFTFREIPEAYHQLVGGKIPQP